MPPRNSTRAGMRRTRPGDRGVTFEGDWHLIGASYDRDDAVRWAKGARDEGFYRAVKIVDRRGKFHVFGRVP